VRAFWDHAAPELGLDAQFIAQAVERAGGNLQHAVMLRLHLSGLPHKQRRASDIPRGLLALIASAWERIAIEPPVVDGLGILCAARDALTLDELGRVAGWSHEPQRRAFLRGARELLIETRRASRVSEYRLHHDAIRAHVAETIGTDGLAAHHHVLTQCLATWPAPADAAARRYALHHALLHRAEAGAWADAWRVAADVAFLEAKCRELGVHDAETDVARTAARCRASGDEAHGGRFAELARALGRESHWLRAAPEATAALVWNRLRRSGWSASELDAQLRVPEGVAFLRVRHAATRESPALVRDLAGHTDGVTACAVTPDSRHVVSVSWDGTLKVWVAARLVTVPAGESPVGGGCPATTVVISGGGKGDQPAGSPDVKVSVSDREASNLAGCSGSKTGSPENEPPRVSDCGEVGSAEPFSDRRKAAVVNVIAGCNSIDGLSGVLENDMPRRNRERKPGTTRGSPRRSRTAKAVRISRHAVKSRCACEWDGWGRVSEDGSGQNNPNPSEDPWGRATMVACTAVCDRIQAPDIELVELWITKPTKDEDKPSGATSMPGAGLIRASFREGLA
jgi:hypothetical protein